MIRLVRCIGSRALAAFFFLLLATTFSTSAQDRKVLQGHVSQKILTLRPLGRVPAATNLDLALGLPLRNREALTNLLDQLYDPSSPLYRQYLSSEEFTKRFGPTEADYEAVIKFAQANGLKVTGTHPNRVLLDVRGSVADIEKAFRTTINLYQHPAEPRKFRAPGVEPSVPAVIPIQDMSGLDDFQRPQPMNLRRNETSNDAGGVISNATGSGPGGDFMGKDFRAAYAPGVTNDGAGQIIGLFEFGPYYTNDIYMYETNTGLPTTIVITNILLDGVSGIPSGSNADDGEEALDIDMVISMAPGATVLVYEGNNGNDIFNRMATDNYAKQMSCSFGYSPMPASTEQIFQQFAAQGQSMFVASGDGGAYPSNPGAIFPQAEDPYLTIVGGTSLSTSGAGGPWASEPTWGGGGGGTSTRWGIPSWQAGINMQRNLGSTTYRNIPDVAMLADTVIFWVFKNGTVGTVGGTSAAAPLWAGFTALINQEAGKQGKPPVGFLNPAIYAIGKGLLGSYLNAFHDISTGSNQKFPAVSGYDLCTGWGTPKGSSTINALVGKGTNDFTLYASPGLPTMVPGSVAVTTLSLLPLGGFSGSINLSVSGLPSGVTALLSTSNTTSTSTLTLMSSSSAAAGNYTVTVTGAAAGLTHAFALNLIIQPAIPGATRVPLFYNRSGIYTDGSRFSGGADGAGFAYSATALGAAPAWNNILFNLGPANGLNVVSSSSQTIAPPSGAFTTLQLLAAGVNGNQLSQTFTVTYTDNSTTIFTQSLSDWAAPQSFPGESIAVSMPYRNSGNGTKDTGTRVNVYGYCFTLNPAKTVKTITLPGNGNVLVLAIVLANAPTPASLTSTYNRIGIYTDGSKFGTTNGLDGGGSAYSAAWLGGAQTWNGTLFKFPPANALNSISCTGQTVALPTGNFVNLRMLATGVQGNQSSQSFVVTYSDATTTTLSQSLSDWFTPQSYPGETKAIIMGYRNTSTGSKDNHAFYLYGYSLPLNSGKTVQSVRLPNNAKVEVLALTLTPNWPPSFLNDPFNETSGTAGQPYSANVATNAFDPNGDTITFAKVSGPGWLTISSNGLLSGTPANSDAGTNTFVLSATDPGGLSTNATLFIDVIGTAAITASISLQGTNAVLSWSGGSPPYQIQTTADLTTTNWAPFGPSLNANSLTLSATNTAAFYRIIGQ